MGGQNCHHPILVAGRGRVCGRNQGTIAMKQYGRRSWWQLLLRRVARLFKARFTWRVLVLVLKIIAWIFRWWLDESDQ